MHPGGAGCSGGLAQLRAAFYRSPNSSELHAWAKVYRDFSKALVDVIKYVVPQAIAPQVLIIDSLRACDDAALKATAKDRAAVLRWHAAFAGVLTPVFALLFPAAAPFCAAGLVLNGALAQVLDDYAAGRPLSMGTLLRAAGGMAALVGASGSMPPAVKQAMSAAKSSRPMRDAVVVAVDAHAPPLAALGGKLPTPQALAATERAMGLPPGTLRPPPAPSPTSGAPGARSSAMTSTTTVSVMPTVSTAAAELRRRAIDDAKARAKAAAEAKARENAAKYPGKTFAEILEIEGRAAAAAAGSGVPWVKIGLGLGAAVAAKKAFDAWGKK